MKKNLKNLLITSLILAFTASCQSFNHKVREDFPEQEPMRHGIVPLPKRDGLMNNNDRNQKAEKRGHIREGVVKKRIAVVEEKFDYPIDEASVARGKVLYKNNCISCHGPNGQGDGPKAKNFDPKPANLTLLAKEVPNFQFYMMVSRYQGDMPGWKHVFTKKDITDLEHYLRSLSRFEE